MCMLPSHDRLKYVLGGPSRFSPRPLPAFAPQARTFLARLSERLVADPAVRAMPDATSFAWWCRKANIERLATSYEDGILRIGRGLAFHVTPANVPINFAFSWAFSLLAGNANVVRLPHGEWSQIDVILGHLEALLEEARFAELFAMNAFVAYGHEPEITREFSGLADVRIVWGGDQTIQHLRSMALPPRALDVAFADRYSFCLLASREVLALDEEPLARLAARFFNDAYTIDQNACSSPRLVVWLGGAKEIESARRRFWNAVESVVRLRYQLTAVSVVDKLTQACRDAIELNTPAGLEREDSRLYRLRLTSLFAGIENRRCAGGYFYEYGTERIDDVARLVTAKYQTLTYYGVPRQELISFVEQSRLCGIDRIVPVGEALNLGLVWDGFDLIHTLSRVCDIH